MLEPRKSLVRRAAEFKKTAGPRLSFPEFEVVDVPLSYDGEAGKGSFTIYEVRRRQPL